MSDKLHQRTDASSSEGAIIPGVEEDSLVHKAVTMVAVAAPFAALVAGMRTSSKKGKFTKTEAATMVTFHTVAAFGVTVGLHRLFTHKSFDTTPRIRKILARAACTSVEGQPRTWVADHRRHHRFSDKPGDPHSPHVEFDEMGLVGIPLGLFHAQVGWLVKEGTSTLEEYAPDLLTDEILEQADREFPAWVAFTLLAPAAISALTAGKGNRRAGALRGFLWGGLVRMGITHHITWSVNSICHTIGKRPFRSRDKSTNNVVVAVLAFGEGWHHNHHVFARSAFHGLTAGQRALDLSGWLILLLEKKGLAWDVIRIDEEEMDELRLAPA
ncbi:acyl-CoA desaturase [Candidatus Saccharibacteria bacterium]|nr:acyl-CoA desaturase [Candidatus Saccharibacteria bacterium]